MSGASTAVATTAGRGQAAAWLAGEGVDATLWCLDSHDAELCQSFAPEVDVRCVADLSGTFNLGVVPTTVRDEAEWTRDALQQVFQSLDDGGTLIASVDNPRDTWLHAQMSTLADKVTADRGPKACVYEVVKRRPPRRVRSFDAAFDFRDRGNNVSLVTRPGVFSHRRVDAGAVALLKAVEVPGGASVLDLGCGPGSIALALAVRGRGFRERSLRVTAVDSNVRAVQCTRVGSERNAVNDRIDTVHDHRVERFGEGDVGGTFDVVVANPPYFSDFDIARRFVAGAAAALRPGGVMHVVTKRPRWYAENLGEPWSDLSSTVSGNYVVVTAFRREREDPR